MRMIGPGEGRNATNTLVRCALGLSLLVTLGCPAPGSDDDESSTNCDELEPENPYPSDSGHYAGFEWAEENEPDSCDGNSLSFIEGCEEYQRQSEAHEACESKK